MAFGRGRFAPLFRRLDAERFRVALSADQRALIDNLLEDLERMLGGQSPALWRLHPEPYGDDVERNAGYAVLAGSELIEQRSKGIALVRSNISADELSADQLDQWMRTINDLRLVLGTILDVSEDGSEPEDEAARELFYVYEHLGFILEHIVSALME